MTFATTHFDFHLCDGLGRADVDAVVTRLEAEHRRIVDDLQVLATPRARVEIWSNETSLCAAMLETIGTVYMGAKGYVLGPTDLRLVMLGDPPQTAVHELAHAVHELAHMEAVIALIGANGDIHGILGITVPEFEQGWHDWLEREYF